MNFWKRLFGQKATEPVLKLNLQDASPIQATDVSKPDSAPALTSKQRRTPQQQQEAPRISATGMDKDKAIAALTAEQQKALWLDSITLELLSSDSVITFTVGESGGSEQQVGPEVAKWAKPLVDLIKKADTLSRNDRYSEAIEIYKQVLEKAPNAAIVLMSIGCCYGNMGDKKNALQWLRLALKAAPSNERIHRNLAALERM